MAAPFVIGTDAICADGVCGQVSRVVVDPADWSVTHLVVAPSKRQELGRLVPLDLVDAGIQLSITKQQVKHLPPVNLDHPDR